MNSLSGGGMERAMLNLANFFAEQGADVDLLVASINGPLLIEVPDSIKLIDLKSRKSKTQLVRWWFVKAAVKLEPWLLMLCFTRKLPKAVKVIPRLIEYLEENNPDAILSTPTTANLAVIWAKSYCGYDNKTVIREASTLSEVIQNESSIFFKLTKRFVRKWYNRADMVICVSEGVGKDLRKNFLVQEQKTHTIYNILDIDKIKKQSLSRENELLLQQFGNYVLSAGRLAKEKDFETLIRAFHLISNDISENLVILGEGSERAKLEGLIAQLGLESRVYLPGFFVNPYPFIARCDVFALSSRWEGCPNVLREALIFNKKIISTDCDSGPREILKDGELGILVAISDVESYSKQLHNLIEEPGSNYGLSSVLADQTLSEQFYKKLLSSVE